MMRQISLVAACVLYAHGAAIAAPAAMPGGENPSPGDVVAPQAADSSRYPGFAELVNAHREAQVKMVKKWRELKGQSPPQEATFAEYRRLQEETQKASGKVTKFIQQSKWTEDDRKELNRIWNDVLSKDVP
jgi:hypothetical protein